MSRECSEQEGEAPDYPFRDISDTNFGTGKKVKAAADPQQLPVTQFFKKQKQ